MAVPQEERRKTRKPAGIPAVLFYPQSAFSTGPVPFITEFGLVYQYAGPTGSSYQYNLVGAQQQQQQQAQRGGAGQQQQQESNLRVAGNSGNNSVR